MVKILVIGEYAEGKVRKGTLAAITFARQAAARTG